MANKKSIFFALTTTVLIMLIISGITAKAVAAAYKFVTGSVLFPPIFPLVARKCDSYGCGHFGASRDGGKRKHQGQDYITRAGQDIFSPSDGTLTTAPAYADGRYPELKLIKITNGTMQVNIMYAAATVPNGQVKRGEKIGVSQSLQNRYPGIPNHAHIEVKIGGIKVNPVDYFTESKTQLT